MDKILAEGLGANNYWRRLFD